MCCDGRSPAVELEFDCNIYDDDDDHDGGGDDDHGGGGGGLFKEYGSNHG